MYTELVLKCEICSDVSDEVHTVLKYLFDGGDAPANLPDHPFFNTHRWEFIGKCSSFHHIPFALSKYTNPNQPDANGGYIFSRSDLKNYEDEIHLFIDWLMPHIDELEGVCIGWSWYEEEDQPTLLFKK